MLAEHWRVCFVLLALLVACGPSNERRAVESVADSLVGTWRVISHVQGVSESEGSTVKGYLVYDRTGHVFAQLARRGAADSLNLRRWYELPDSTLKGLIGGFRAYFGTYQVDIAARTVTPRIEGEFLPRRGQEEVATPFRLSADTLTLGADSSERWVFLRVSPTTVSRAR